MGDTACIHVLVVDDCLVDRKVVEKLVLKAGNFRVTTVSSGEKALDTLGLTKESAEVSCADDNRVDLILSDYCMPGLNGHDLLKAVKDHTCLKHIPVIMMSSENNPERISRCRAIGAEDFILKPLRLRDVQKLRNYARHITPVTKTGSKRKVPLDIMPENGQSGRRLRLAGVVA